jgi:glycosyltransferase involved in cell wall biosynthesis
VAAVVPAHNEEELIGRVIATMPELVDRIIVIDDCSTDRTSDVAADTGDGRVTVLRHERNTGVGGAILDGHRRVMDEGVDVAVVMAGDAQMDPRYLPDLLDPIVEEGYGFTKANRFFSMSSFQDMPSYRVLGNVVLSFMTKVASGYWHIFDPQNGYTAIRRDVLERLPLERISLGYRFENDLLINLNILNVRARDVPVPAIYGSEVSGIRLSRVVPSISSLLIVGFWRRIWWKYVLWSFSPIAMLLLAGLALCAFGFGVGVFAVVSAFHHVSPSTGTVMMSVGPLLVGINLMVQALVLDIQATPD